MSDSDSDDGFVGVFAGRRNAKQAADKVLSHGVDSRPGVAVRPPERRINAAVRQQQRAVNTIIKRNNLARNLALDGISAMDQAGAVGDVVDEPEPDNSAVGRDGSSSIAPITASTDIPVDQALTFAFETQNDANATQAQKMQAWALVSVTADKIVANKSSTAAEVDQAVRSAMMALTRVGQLQASAGQLRAAIDANERAIEWSKRTKSDAAIFNGLKMVHEKLLDLYSRIGNADAVKRHALGAKRCQAALAMLGAASKKPDAADASVPQAALEGSSGSTEAAASDSAESSPAAVPAKSSAADAAAQQPSQAAAAEASPSTAAQQEEATPSAAGAQPEQEFEMPVIVQDGSATSMFLQAITDAMFKDSFDSISALLNKSLLGDVKAGEALRMAAPDYGATLLMVAAAQGRADLVRRLVAAHPVRDQAAQITQVKDAQRNNAIAHACNTGRSGALHELLMSLHATGPAYRSYTPPGAVQPEKASLPDVGIALDQAQSFPMYIQDQLRSFLRDPVQYCGYGKTTGAALSVLLPPTLTAAAAAAPVAAAAAPQQSPKPAPAAPAVPAPASAASRAPFEPPTDTMSPLVRAQIAAAQASFMNQMFAMMQSMGMPSAAAGGGAYGRGGTGRPGGAGGAWAGGKPRQAGQPSTGGGYAKPGKQQATPVQNAQPAPKQRFTSSQSTEQQQQAAAAPAAGPSLDEWATATGKAGKKQQAKQQQAQLKPAHKPDNVSKAAGQGKLVGRQLVKMELGGDDAADGGAGGLSGELEPAKGSGGKSSAQPKWDQFAANEQLFGVKATYREDMYTSALDKKKFSKEQLAAADKLAAEILASEAGDNPHIRAERGVADKDGDGGLDEEDLHSAVLPAPSAGASGSASSSSNATGSSASGKKDAFTDSGIATKVSSSSAAAGAAGSGKQQKKGGKQ